jgi:uncharacterized protein YecE (DUF72 family)
MFSVVEVQQTFYQPPRLATLSRWRSQVPGEFEFTLKAWQLITHESGSPTYRRLREKLNDQQRREAGAFRMNATVLGAWRRTCECARVLGSRIVLLQCPPSFTPTPEHKANLRGFIREISGDLPSGLRSTGLILVWEPRGDWKAEEVQEMCDELGLVHGVDPFMQRPTTSGLGYFRLHGRTGYRYRYTDADLLQLLRETAGRTPCYVLFNNLAMRDDARRFRELAAQNRAAAGEMGFEEKGRGPVAG